MRNRLAIDIASKIKNVTGLILVDGCRFFDYEKYFEVLNNFKKLIEKIFNRIKCKNVSATFGIR